MKPQISYYSNGQIRSERWINKEAMVLHRLDGPAVRYWFEDGRARSEEWWVNGQLHKLDGSAFRMWCKNGRLECEEWHINGVKYDTEAEFQTAVDLYNANEIAELF